MHQIRTVLVAMLALCLAVFPAGMSRASVPMPGTGVAASHEHVHAPGVAPHDHADTEHKASGAKGDGHSHQATSGADHDCAGHGKDGKHCASTCCGLGCHALQLALEPVLATPLSHSVQCAIVHDDQVGGGMPFSIERPPRFV